MKQDKNKKFDIIVGIPTYNEADSIANTVQKIDRGLTKYFPDHRSLIVNVDSKSNDGTRRVFLSTKTKTAKISLSSGKQKRGKGTNIFFLLRLSKNLGAKYVATIDADIATITEKWIKLLLDQAIRKKADFVAPIYTRNRYEGNTTNHFCFPLLYAWFGRLLNQPIGGDFAMSSRFANYVLRQQKPKSSHLYGIDIFLSTHAVGANFKIEEVYLGRKIHKPSFDKIILMFQQVAATIIFVLSQYKKQRKTSHLEAAPKSLQRADSFIRKPDETKIASLRKYALQSLRELPTGDIHKYLGLNFKKVESIRKASTMPEDGWVMILANLSDYIVTHSVSDHTATKIATTLSPFFFLRVLAYFEELDKTKRQKNVDMIIFNQAQKLRNSIVSTNVTIDLDKKNSYTTSQQISSKVKQGGGETVMKDIKVNPDAWKYWYPTKEETVDEDMPFLGKYFRDNDVSKILDLGCGTGRHAIYFAEREFNVYGFDFAKDAIKKAKEISTRKRLGIKFRVWDARKTFPCTDECFDAVLVVRVIHHYPTKIIKQIVKEIKRVTRKGGYVYIQAPILKRVLKYATLAKKKGRPQIKLEKGTFVPTDGSEKGVPHHGFTKEELQELFQAFQIKSITLRDEHYNLLGIKK